jgi:hypothetical protein
MIPDGQPSSPLHQHLAARLADACINPSYMADLWAVYFHRFQEVVTAEMREQSTVSPECPQD